MRCETRRMGRYVSLILVVEVNAEVLLASALASEITATTFVALEATTLVAFLETFSTEVTATLAVALEAAASTLVIVVIIASTAADT